MIPLTLLRCFFFHPHHLLGCGWPRCVLSRQKLFNNEEFFEIALRDAQDSEIAEQKNFIL
jgi:hypothetical protein